MSVNLFVLIIIKQEEKKLVRSINVDVLYIFHFNKYNSFYSSRPASSIRQHEPLMYVSPKRTKYVTMTSSAASQQILRSQLQIPKDSSGNEVEVKSEPIAILSNQVGSYTTCFVYLLV